MSVFQDRSSVSQLRDSIFGKYGNKLPISGSFGGAENAGNNMDQRDRGKMDSNDKRKSFQRTDRLAKSNIRSNANTMEEKPRREVSRQDRENRVSQCLEEARRMVTNARGPRKVSTPGNSLRQAISSSMGMNDGLGGVQQDYRKPVYPASYGPPMHPRDMHQLPKPEQPQYGMQPMFTFPPKQDDFLSRDELPRRYQQMQPFDTVETRKERELSLALKKGPKKKPKKNINFELSEVDKLVCSRLDQQPDSQLTFKPLGSLVNKKAPLGNIVKSQSRALTLSDHMLPSSFGAQEHNINEESYINLADQTTLNSKMAIINQEFFPDVLSPAEYAFDRPQTPPKDIVAKSPKHVVSHSDRMLPSFFSLQKTSVHEESFSKLNIVEESKLDAGASLKPETLPVVNSPSTDAFNVFTDQPRDMTNLDNLPTEMQQSVTERSSLKNPQSFIKVEDGKMCLAESKVTSQAMICGLSVQTQTNQTEVDSVTTNTPLPIFSSMSIQIDLPCKYCSASSSVDSSNHLATCSTATQTLNSVGTQTDEPCSCRSLPKRKTGSAAKQYEVVRHDQGRILLRRICEKGDEPSMDDILRASYNVSRLMPIPPKGRIPPRVMWLDRMCEEPLISEEHLSTTTVSDPTVELRTHSTKSTKSAIPGRAKDNSILRPRSKKKTTSEPKEVKCFFEGKSRADVLEHLRALFRRIRSRQRERYYRTKTPE